MKNLSLLLSLVCTCFLQALVLAAAEPALPWYAALRTVDAPVMDGELNDACWRAAETTTPFVVMGGGTAAPVGTSGRLCWDERHLYLALMCEEPSMARIETRIAGEQIGAFDESLEVFLDTSGQRGSFVHLLLGITGERRSLAGGVPSEGLQNGWTAKVRRSTNRWIAELAISLAVLTDQPPSADRVWAMNLNRTRSVDPGSPQYHCWSATRGAFAEPDRFGNLIFAPYPLWLRARYTALTAGLTAEIADLMMRYPQASDSLRDGLSRLDGTWLEVLRTIEAPGADAPAGRDAMRARADQAVGLYEDFLGRLRLAVVGTQFQ
ncbi:MAG: sugar-binding protein [Kiritimatiellae bacterium]|nr:sugar-binding protein [Kiritimatiellia bacterium]